MALDRCPEGPSNTRCFTMLVRLVDVAARQQPTAKSSTAGGSDEMTMPIAGRIITRPWTSKSDGGCIAVLLSALSLASLAINLHVGFEAPWRPTRALVERRPKSARSTSFQPYGQIMPPLGGLYLTRQKLSAAGTGGEHSPHHTTRKDDASPLPSLLGRAGLPPGCARGRPPTRRGARASLSHSPAHSIEQTHIIHSHTPPLSF